MIRKLIFLLRFVALFSAVIGLSNGIQELPSLATEYYEETCECGEINKPSLFRPVIINGEEVMPPNKYPWMVSLLSVNDGFMCGGSLISRYFVLTAGHCFIKYSKLLLDPFMYKICIGARESTVNTCLRIQRIIVHPKFDTSGVKYDIALVQLCRPVTCNLHLRPICLPIKVPVPRTGKEVIISGWGLVQNIPGLGGSRQLMEGIVQIQSKNVCRRINPASTTHICAGGTSQATCVGDSGGPLFAAVHEKFYIFGITSFGDLKCDTRMPKFYTNVKRFLRWIRNIVDALTIEKIAELQKTTNK